MEQIEKEISNFRKLKDVPKQERKINFITAIALSDGKKTISVEAIIQGYVAEEPRGENGFGFDEIFELENGKTLAELSNDEKKSNKCEKKSIRIIKRKVKIFSKS